MRRLLVVDRDDDREHQVVGDRGRSPSLRQKASPSVSMSHSQPFGVAGEAADRGIETPSGTRAVAGLEGAGRRGGGRRANIHRVRILPASARPATASGPLHRGRPGECGPAGGGPATLDTIQDKRRAGPREAGSRRPGRRAGGLAAAGNRPRKRRGPPPVKGAARCVVGESRPWRSRSAGRPVGVGPDQVAGGLGAVGVAGDGGGGGVVGGGRRRSHRPGRRRGRRHRASSPRTASGSSRVLGAIVVPPHCFEGTVIDWPERSSDGRSSSPGPIRRPAGE